MQAEPDKLSEVIHALRNQLNQISMHTEVAKLLLEQDDDHDKIFESMTVILNACAECDATLTAFKNNSEIDE